MADGSTTIVRNAFRDNYDCNNYCGRLPHRLSRRKPVDWNHMEVSNLARRLTTIDLIALGIGSTMGAGAYVVTGVVAKSKSGPAACLSFLLAAVASILAGLCYAEFGAMVPKTGSVYTFSYITIGEYVAFVIGWDLLLEYVIGTASVARTASSYLDALVDGKIENGTVQNFFKDHLNMDVSGLAPYADLIALAIVLIITGILVAGVKESSWFNNLFTVMNLIILTFIILAGAKWNNTKNWNLSAGYVNDTANCPPDTDQTPPQTDYGSGGFAPYGFNGIVSGAATAFFAFVGFDAIATTGEEVKKPHRAIPLSICISLVVILTYYFALSITVTMMAPYCKLNVNAPFSQLFDNVGWTWAKYLADVGALCALSTSMLGGMFPMPRIVLAMARDGLIFRFFSYVHPKLKTAIPATIFMGVFTGVMAMLFDIDSLANMMSIGTLLAYTLVSACVLLLRYENTDEKNLAKSTQNGHANFSADDSLLTYKIKSVLFPNSNVPTLFSAKLVKILTIFLTLNIIGLCAILTFVPQMIFVRESMSAWAVVLFVLFTIDTLVSVGIIMRQPQTQKSLSFRVPLLPVLPALSIFFNVYLMLALDYMTWIRFAVWLIIGFFMYFGYGMFHSSEEIRDRTGYEPQIQMPDNGDIVSINEKQESKSMRF